MPEKYVTLQKMTQGELPPRPSDREERLFIDSDSKLKSLSGASGAVVDLESPADRVTLDYTGTLPAQGIPLILVPPQNDLMVGLTGAQIAAVRGGKWLAAFALTGYGNKVTDALVSIGSSDLVGIRDGFSLSSMNALTTAQFNSLVTVGGAFFLNGGVGMNALTTAQFNSLVTVGGAFYLNSGSSMNALTTAQFNSLVTVGGAFFLNSGGGMNALTTAQFNSLVTVGGAFFLNGGVGGSMNALTTAQFNSLVTVGGAFYLNGGGGSMNALRTFLLGPIKTIAGDISSGNTLLDGNSAWKASTRYAAESSQTSPASNFSSIPGGTVCTATVTGHGLAVGDMISVTGIGSATSPASHNFNANHVPVLTVPDANTFTYAITATSQAPFGTATIFCEGTGVFSTTRNGRKYIATTTGTTAGSEPAWPTTVGETVVDGGVTWRCSEASYENMLPKIAAMDGTNGTTLYGANRMVTLDPGSHADISTVSSISTAGGVATVTTSAAHPFTVGSQVALKGNTGAATPYNGIWTVATVADNTHFTIAVPSALNGIAGTASSKATSSCPKFSGTIQIPTAIVHAPADAHDVLSSTALLDSIGGTQLPVFFADNYARNGSVNGYSQFTGGKNGMSIWYCTATRRWSMSPTGTVCADIPKYPHTAAGVAVSSITAANPAVVTVPTGTGQPTTAGVIFTVAIQGVTGPDAATMNATWFAKAVNALTFNLLNPDGTDFNASTLSFSATAATVAPLNTQSSGFLQGQLSSGSIASPVQAVKATVTLAGHGYSTGDLLHFYGAQGTDAAAANDLFANATTNSMPTAITKVDDNTFTFTRYAYSQPKVGTLTLTGYPHTRRAGVSDAAYLAAQQLRARGVCANVIGMNGV